MLLPYLVPGAVMYREVQLKAEFAELYPTLESGRWYTAAAVAGLLKATRIIREGDRVQITDRIVLPAHFEFRGGCPRFGSWVGKHTRRIDRHPVGGLQQSI
jgi:hypothetical protein